MNLYFLILLDTYKNYLKKDYFDNFLYLGLLFIVTNLGLTYDNNMFWTSLINNKRIHFSFNFLKRLQYFLPVQTNIMPIISIIRHFYNSVMLKTIIISRWPDVGHTRVIPEIRISLSISIASLWDQLPKTIQEKIYYNIFICLKCGSAATFFAVKRGAFNVIFSY